MPRGEIGRKLAGIRRRTALRNLIRKRRERKAVKAQINKAIARSTPNRRIISGITSIMTNAYGVAWTEKPLLASIVQGDDVMNRTGRTIVVKYVELNYYVTSGSSAPVIYRNVLGSYTNVDTTPLTGIDIYTAIKKVDYPDKGIIKTYYDKTKTISPDVYTAAPTYISKVQHIIIRRWWKKGMKVTYTSGGAPDKELIFSYITQTANAPSIVGGSYRLVFEDA